MDLYGFEKREGMLKRKIEECDINIRKGKEAKKDKKELEKQLKDFLSMDLVRNKKIWWCDIHITDFTKGNIPDFYVYKTDDIEKYGYWKGLNNLSDAEREHFNRYIKDYFYYGYPNSVRIHGGIHGASECEMAFKNGHSLKKICINDVMTKYY
tara:strand:+ start:374 stop:832 length:459 start_codon:yes stop_codon:yes gene_type:complete